MLGQSEFGSREQAFFYRHFQVYSQSSVQCIHSRAYLFCFSAALSGPNWVTASLHRQRLSRLAPWIATVPPRGRPH